MQDENNQQGGYRKLPFFKQSEIIYDFTVEFVKKYIDYKSRTKDQMEQAVRSGKQNIAEGYLQKSLSVRVDRKRQRLRSWSCFNGDF
ncbi:MAG: hypothetical protein Q7R77_03330 [Candidatus Daviesbacteria bacterium]|nr:hypothetical protein [Candidatus Daviesbacteria bacterium]